MQRRAHTSRASSRPPSRAGGEGSAAPSCPAADRGRVGFPCCTPAMRTHSFPSERLSRLRSSPKGDCGVLPGGLSISGKSAEPATGTSACTAEGPDDPSADFRLPGALELDAVLEVREGRLGLALVHLDDERLGELAEQRLRDLVAERERDVRPPVLLEERPLERAVDLALRLVDDELVRHALGRLRLPL